MQVKNVPIDTIHLYPENPREIEEGQFEKLKKSIKEFGFVQSLVVNLRNHESFKLDEKKPTVIGGNMRLRAAKDLGMKEVPIVEIDVDKHREAILNIGLNRITGKWDISKLEKMVYELSDKDLALDLELTGLENWELQLYNPAEDLDEEEIADIVGTDEKPTYILKVVFADNDQYIKAARLISGDNRVRKIVRGEKLMRILEEYEQKIHED